jgi:hypothetical protein
MSTDPFAVGVALCEFGWNDPITMHIKNRKQWCAKLSQVRTSPIDTEDLTVMPVKTIYLFCYPEDTLYGWHFVTKLADGKLHYGSFNYGEPIWDHHLPVFPARYGRKTSLLLACLPDDSYYLKCAHWTPWFPSTLS